MLSRSAQGLYWMGRYLERAEHLCRLLQLQTEALVDRPIREIHFGWSRIYNSVNRRPPMGDLDPLGGEDYTLADSYTLADDLTFERSNPDSVWSCFALGRENARQMRHCISAEMWTGLNLAYLRIQKLGIQDIWSASPESFYAETAAEVDTFMGVTSATMYRDSGWRFLQLGRFVERAQRAVALFLAQIAADRMTGEYSEADWTSLLRAYHAFEAYDRRYSVAVEPGQVLDLLATDPLLPYSLRRSLDRVAAELAVIGAGPNAQTNDAVEQRASRLVALVQSEWPIREDRGALLQQMGVDCWELHDLVTATYFDYPIADLPAR